MSPTRRTATETNILAMLDRHESRGRMRRLLRGLGTMPVMVWYGTAGLMVAGLVGALAWLALDNGAPAAGDGALAGTAGSAGSAGSAGAKGRLAADAPIPAAAQAPAAASAPALAAPPSPIAAASTASTSAEMSARVADAAPAAGATIVDLAPDDAPKPAAPVTAPRVLPPQQHAGRIALQESQAAGQREGQRNPPAERQHQRPAAHAATSRSAPRTAAAAAAATAGKAPSPAAHTAGLAHTEPRSRRPAAQPKPIPAVVDTDVALISAIIQHANKRQEAAEAAAKP